jgi:hypothetical protein
MPRIHRPTAAPRNVQPNTAYSRTIVSRLICSITQPCRFFRLSLLERVSSFLGRGNAERVEKLSLFAFKQIDAPN